MIFIEHRINSFEQLDLLPIEHGAEIDIRSDPSNGKMYLHHDPFVRGVLFDDWLQIYAERKIRGPLILNTKEDGLEQTLIEKCFALGVDNFFFLDTALPTLVKWAIRKSEKRFACRLSVYEPVECIKAFEGKVDWLWVDCFEGQPFEPSVLLDLREKFKICLVSPELQNCALTDRFISLLREHADAVCSKQVGRWRDFA